MEKLRRIKGLSWLRLIVFGSLLISSVKCQRMEVMSSISKNVSGYLVSRDGKFFVQPVFHDQRRTEENRGERKQENGLHLIDEESWIDDGHEVEDSGELSIGPISEEFIAEDSANYEDDGKSWQKRPKSVLEQWFKAKSSRGRGFSFYSMFESAFSTVTKFIGNIIGGDDDDEIDTSNDAISYKDHQLLRISPKSSKQVRYLQELRESEPDDVKFWTSPGKEQYADIVVSPSMLQDVKSFLREKKMAYQVLIADLQNAIKLQNPRVPKERRQDLYSSQGHSLTWKRYHRFKDIMGYLDHLAFKYPNLVEVQSIGKSFEGRPLKIIKVSTGSNKNGEPKPSIWIDAGMHAREWISTAVATYILNQLVEKSDNYTRLLDLTDWVIMPVVNPDGYEFTHTNDRLWRKTRSVHDNEADARQGPGILHMLSHYTKWLFGTCEGVDPNRNFNIHWGEEKVGGASKDPCHDTYAGPSAFSEPETRAISNYLMANKKTIKTYLTLHSYSQMLLVPWGFTRTVKPVDFNDLMNIANKAKKAIHKLYRTEYKVGPAAELLYPTTGSSDDWAKAVAGIKNAFTMELRDRGRFGFLLPANEILPTARETWAGVRVIARMAATDNATSRGL